MRNTQLSFLKRCFTVKYDTPPGGDARPPLPESNSVSVADTGWPELGVADSRTKVARESGYGEGDSEDECDGQRWAFRSKVRLRRVERLRKWRGLLGLTIARALTSALGGDQAEDYIRARGVRREVMARHR